MQMWKTMDGSYVMAQSKRLAALAGNGIARWISYPEAMEIIASGETIRVIREPPVIEAAQLRYEAKLQAVR